jgi:hypothetical protein
MKNTIISKSKTQLLFAILFVLLNSIAIQSSAQYVEEENKPQIIEWEPGYIVLKGRLDTLKGYLNIKTTTSDYIKKVWFRKDKDSRKGMIKIGGAAGEDMSVLIYWGIAKHRYKYIESKDVTFSPKQFQSQLDMKGWVEILEENNFVTIFKGFAIDVSYNSGMMMPTGGPGGGMMMTGGGFQKNYIPMYYLKKADHSSILILAPSSLFKGDKINDENKNYFIGFISDDTALADKLKNTKLLFGDIERYVREYNEWAKNSSK